MIMQKRIPSSKEIIQKLPLDKNSRQFIKQARVLAKKIFLKEDKRFIIFVGPCSIHSQEEIIDYAKRLKRIIAYANKNIFIVMRFFYEKARTSTGWKGFLYDPYLDNTNNIEEGVIKTRKLMIQLSELNIPLAAELLDPLTINYFKDLITWGFIGSRTSTSQIHRQLASSLPFPVGLKNPSDGNLETTINSVISARSPHSFLHLSDDDKISIFQSSGNLFSHIVLRGSENNTNYDRNTLNNLYEKMQKKHLYSPIVIDSAHGNSKKSIYKQKKCFEEVIKKAKDDPNIIGVMLESFIKEGNQKITSKNNLRYGVSITDPCIGWDDTRKLLVWVNEYLPLCRHR